MVAIDDHVGGLGQAYRFVGLTVLLGLGDQRLGPGRQSAGSLPEMRRDLVDDRDGARREGRRRALGIALVEVVYELVNRRQDFIIGPPNRRRRKADSSCSPLSLKRDKTTGRVCIQGKR
jgi:hypothetical protein